MNSYQAILITNGLRSFAVFIYNCDRLDPQSVAGIGYYFNESVQMEHILSSTSTSSRIACENTPCTPWNSIVYPLFGKCNFQYTVLSIFCLLHKRVIKVITIQSRLELTYVSPEIFNYIYVFSNKLCSLTQQVNKKSHGLRKGGHIEMA